ncbi:MAG: hypothetical protein MUF12_00975 [Sediminibacterium sp.]|jgi:hypothetical protein|nr:hypothetical protein [Sediminibacterium sp.]
MKKFTELKALVDGLENDFTAFYEKKNQSAGTRIRVGMQKIKSMAQEIRVDVQEIKNSQVKS